MKQQVASLIQQVTEMNERTKQSEKTATTEQFLEGHWNNVNDGGMIESGSDKYVSNSWEPRRVQVPEASAELFCVRSAKVICAVEARPTTVTEYLTLDDWLKSVATDLNNIVLSGKGKTLKIRFDCKLGEYWSTNAKKKQQSECGWEAGKDFCASHLTETCLMPSPLLKERS